MSSEANWAGANFVTKDKPIGDKHNSASVADKYVKNNHQGETSPLSPAKCAAQDIINAEQEINTKAKQNFITEVGSLPFSAK